MKKALILCLVIILVVGSVSVFADPHPSGGTTSSSTISQGGYNDVDFCDFLNLLLQKHIIKKPIFKIIRCKSNCNVHINYEKMNKEFFDKSSLFYIV